MNVSLVTMAAVSAAKQLRSVKAIAAVAAPATLLGALAFAPSSALAGANFDLGDGKSLSLGAGLRAQYVYTDAGDINTQDFSVQSIRLYMNGQAHENVKFTFNTEKIDGQSVDVLDAIARFEFSKGFNVWFGRMLTPADRIEMNGPYYALTWNQYTQPLYPSDQGGQAGRLGRDEGVTVWGAAGKFQYAVGLFDGVRGFGNSGDDKLLVAGRFAYNFLNMEDNPGYYTSSTYFGSLGNIFTLGVSFQTEDGGTGSAEQPGDFSGYTIDLLSETVLGESVLTIEAEYKDFDADYTSGTPTTVGNCFCLFDGESAFISAAFLTPGKSFQPYVRFVSNEPTDGEDSDLAELGLNYIMNGHNTRLNLNISSGDANISGYQGPDVDSLSFGVQLQF
ncbi:MAG: hypothetical protein COA42_12895 [Alteromonadaceae bacterium]|nr:MAG: hypothetical protein COA42_12895 [Alteromonadaceae bacterium]